jgi:hypothetical protein
LETTPGWSGFFVVWSRVEEDIPWKMIIFLKNENIFLKPIDLFLRKHDIFLRFWFYSNIKNKSMYADEYLAVINHFY